MGYIVFHMRESEADRFESSLKKAKRSLAEACEIYEDMKSEFSGRGYEYDERYDGRYSPRGGYDERDYHRRRDPDWDERRDSRGRYM